MKSLLRDFSSTSLCSLSSALLSSKLKISYLLEGLYDSWHIIQLHRKDFLVLGTWQEQPLQNAAANEGKQAHEVLVRIVLMKRDVYMSSGMSVIFHNENQESQWSSDLSDTVINVYLAWVGFVRKINRDALQLILRHTQSQGLEHTLLYSNLASDPFELLSIHLSHRLLVRTHIWA